MSRKNFKHFKPIASSYFRVNNEAVEMLFIDYL